MSNIKINTCEACAECLCPSCANQQCRESQCTKCRTVHQTHGLTDAPIVCQQFINAKRPTLYNFKADDPLRVSNC